MSSNLFGIGLSGLKAANWGLSTTGQNISNQATPGYSVETAEFEEAPGQSTGSGYQGSGVNTTTVKRAYSQYLTTQLNNATATNSAITANSTMATQLNNLVGSPTGGISAAITEYFSSLSSVANNPSSLSTRQGAVSDAQVLASDINSAGQQYDQLRVSVNQQVSTSVTQVNDYAKQIANLNTQIKSASAQGQSPNQLMDQRDLAVANLSQQIGVSVVQNDDGYSVFLGNGQPLVVGNQSFQLAAVTSPSNPTNTVVAYAGLSGSAAAAVTSATADILSDSALTGGTLGGLHTFVTQTLDPAQAQLGAIATSFAAQVNAQNGLGQTLTGAAGGALFKVSDPTVYANVKNTGGAALTVTLANATQAPSDNYSLSYDGANYTVTDTTTGKAISSSATMPTSVGGMNFTVTGTMAAGDSFTILPTAGALNSFALSTTSPSDIAAASPVLASASNANTGAATISQGTVAAGWSIPSSMQLTYDSTSNSLSGFPVGSTVTVGSNAPVTITSGAPTPTTVPFSAGSSITVDTAAPAAGPNAVSFTISGTPGNGDTFTVAPNAGGSNDSRNALALANLVSSPVLSNGTLTLTGAYSNYVNQVGNTASQLQTSSTAQSALVTQITASQQSVQGVNLDEEAANLMQYQQLYQANSKVIQTAESLFQTLLGIFQ